MLHVSGSFVNAAVVYLLIGSLHMLPFNITYENFFFFFTPLLCWFLSLYLSKNRLFKRFALIRINQFFIRLPK